MSTTNTSRNCIVRSKAKLGSRALLCVVVFLATGTTAIWMRSRESRRTEWYSATATIWQQRPPSDSAKTDPSHEPPGLDPVSIQRELLSDQSLRCALGRLNPPPPDQARAVTEQAIEQARRQLRVSSSQESSSLRRGTLVTFLDGDPDRAMRLANLIAQGYAERQRAKLEATVHQDYLSARDAAEVARKAYIEAKARLDDFVAQHFLRQQSFVEREVERRTESDSSEAPPATDPANGPGDAPAPPPIEDPEHVELRRRLAELEQQRATLLLSRTPAHPEVQYVDTQIAQLGERLASMPRGAAEVPPVPPPSVAPAPESPPLDSLSDGRDATWPDQAVEESAEAVRAYDAHKEALDRARHEYDRLSELKRRAWQRELGAASIELDLADGARPCRPTERSPRSLLEALAVSLAAAFGVGMISSGFDTDLPFTTPAEVERALRVPVVGRIPAKEWSPPRTARRRARRLAKILGGTLLVAACFAILVAAL